jgi:hypothetical protein
MTDNPTLTASQQADAAYEAKLQAIIAAGSTASAPLRQQAQTLQAQADALLKQALALEGPDVQAARRKLQDHHQMTRPSSLRMG